MTNKQVIEQTAEHLKSAFSGESSGHDWFHMYRVWQTARTIIDSEPGADKFVAELGALMHDIADFKFNDGDEEAGPREARRWLENLDVNNLVIEQIEDIIRSISYRGAGVEMNLKSLEAKIVYDADKLDAIGAIGIARVFAYGGTFKRPI